MTLALDDFADTEHLYPTHIKIDVDGAETEVLKGAASILANPTLKQVFIEIDNKHLDIIDQMTSYGFEVKWSVKKPFDHDVLFTRDQDSAFDGS